MLSQAYVARKCWPRKNRASLVTNASLAGYLKEQGLQAYVPEISIANVLSMYRKSYTINRNSYLKLIPYYKIGGRYVMCNTS